MLRKFVLCTGCLLLVSLIACSDSDKLTGGTVDPNTVAENSSSSEADSLDVVSSSSESGGKGVSSSGTSETENGLNVPVLSSSTFAQACASISMFLAIKNSGRNS